MTLCASIAEPRPHSKELMPIWLGERNSDRGFPASSWIILPLSPV